MIAKKTMISHLHQSKENGLWIIQSNDEHQKGVAEMAVSFAGQFGLSFWGYALGLLHDKGKERAAFQQYIRRVNGLLTDDKRRYDDHTHAFVCAILAKELFVFVTSGFKNRNLDIIYCIDKKSVASCFLVKSNIQIYNYCRGRFNHIS